jgi:hypothetical protein
MRRCHRVSGRFGERGGKRANRDARHCVPTRLHNAIHDNLPDVVAVLDAFDVVRLGVQVVDEVWHRVQQHILGLHGHKHDPLYKIRGLLRHGLEHLTDKAADQPLPRRQRPTRRTQHHLAGLPATALRVPRHRGERTPDRDQGAGQLPHLSDPIGCQARPHTPSGDKSEEVSASGRF